MVHCFNARQIDYFILLRDPSLRRRAMKLLLIGRSDF